MKRKTTRPTKAPARARPPQAGKATHQAKRDAIDALVEASARALGLTLDPAWQASVAFNLQLIFSHAARIDEFALPDDAEPAAVFHA